jgi:hypothetical protein
MALALALVTTVVITALESTDGSQGSGDGSDTVVLWLLLGLIVGLLLLWTFIGLIRANPSPEAVVMLAYRSEAPTWSQRNQTQVVLGVVTNVVVGAVFFVLGLWVGGD